jgi:hypothetical protein
MQCDFSEMKLGFEKHHLPTIMVALNPQTKSNDEK